MVTIRQTLNYLNKHKGLVGLADWEVYVKDCRDVDNGDVASIAPDIYEKTLTVELYKDYWNDDWKQTLIHELVHGRMEVMNQRFTRAIKSIHYELEEDCANDITRGLQGLLDE